MNHSSYFIEEKGLFGSYPTQSSVNELEANGVRVFVDLTCNNEVVAPYDTKYAYISFPIRDRCVPTDRICLSRFIISISRIISSLKQGEKIYVHCKGGHGRAGVIVACLLCYIQGIPADEALAYTLKCHGQRNIMKPYWRVIGSPQTKYQKNFVRFMFEPIHIFNTSRLGHNNCLSNFAYISVAVPNVGTFHTLEAAFQAHRNLEDKEYVQSQIQSQSAGYSKVLGRKCETSDRWISQHVDIMTYLINLKIEQHDFIRYYLLKTGLQRFGKYSLFDSYWSIGEDGKGKNILGKIITKARDELYFSHWVSNNLVGRGTVPAQVL